MKVGDVISCYFNVDKDLHKDFINISRDENPMHTNERYAIKHGFNSIIMHGNILSIFLSYAIGELLPKKNIVILDQSIKFFNPIYINSILGFNMEVANYFQSVSVIKFNFSFYDKNKNSKIATGKISIKELK